MSHGTLDARVSFQRSVHEIQLRSSWRRIPQPAMQVLLLFSQDSRAQQEKRDLRARRQVEENRDRETMRTRSIARACNAHRAALDWKRERNPAIFLRILLDRASAFVCFIYSRVCKALPPESRARRVVSAREGRRRFRRRARGACAWFKGPRQSCPSRRPGEARSGTP